MDYRNQNYVTNKIIKKTVDKNQKGYVEEENEEEIITKGILNISVIDNSDEPIDGASILLEEKDGSLSYTGTTDNTGKCTIEEIEYSTYSMTISKESYSDDTSVVTINSESKDISTVLVKGMSFNFDTPTFEETEESEF